MAKLAKRVRSPKARSAKQRSALRKAQLASARKRHMHRKVKPTGLRRRKASVSATSKTRSNVSAYRKAATKSKVNSHRRRKIAAAVAVAGTAAGAVYVYKNREQLIIKHEAERRAISAAKKHAKAHGMKLTKAQIHAVRMDERAGHAVRSTLRVREYKKSREFMKQQSVKAFNAGYTKTTSLRPDRKGNIYSAMRDQGHHVSAATQLAFFESYRKDVHSRAVARFNKRRNSKARFNYDSGKRLLVNKKGVVKRAWW